MIYIYTDIITPRIEYVCHILFNIILQTEFQLCLPSKQINSNQNAVINYSTQNILNALNIPCSGILSETNIRKNFDLSHLIQSFPIIDTTEFSQNQIKHDLFAICFCLLSEYEHYANPIFDKHGRYDEKSYIHSNELKKTPFVHEVAEAFWTAMQNKNPNLFRQQRSFDFEYTFDLDAPWEYLHKSWSINALGWIKDALYLKRERWMRRFKTLLHIQKDAFDTYDFIFQHVPKEKLVFFILLNRTCAEDGRHLYNNPNWIRKIRSLASSSKLGVHPSYQTFLNPSLLAFETQSLEKIQGFPVKRGRQHYLRYRLPATYRAYEDSNLMENYTPCPVFFCGFTHGMALPFPWFDLEKNQVGKMYLHPSQVMDRALLDYMHTSPEEAKAHLTKVVKLTKAVGGKFVALWHNDSLSEVNEWKGWRSVFIFLAKLLAETHANA